MTLTCAGTKPRSLLCPLRSHTARSPPASPVLHCAPSSSPTACQPGGPSSSYSKAPGRLPTLGSWPGCYQHPLFRQFLPALRGSMSGISWGSSSRATAGELGASVWTSSQHPACVFLRSFCFFKRFVTIFLLVCLASCLHTVGTLTFSLNALMSNMQGKANYKHFLLGNTRCNKQDLTFSTFFFFTGGSNLSLAPKYWVSSFHCASLEDCSL